jgi:type I restriction enzyme S subunit
MGQSPSSNSYNTSGDGLPFYQGNADFGEENPVPRSWCTEPKKIAEKGDILISARAPIGAINIADEKCCIGRGVAAIRPNQEVVSPIFMQHQLYASRNKLEAMGTGSTFKAIGKKTLSDFPIVTYPKNTQEAIAQQLNSIKKQIKTANSQLDQLDSLVKSRFVEMFGTYESWKSAKNKTQLDSLCWIGSSKRVHKEDYVSDGVPFFRTKEIVELSKGKQPSTELYIAPEQFKQISVKNSAPTPGDLLITAVGTIGVIWVVDERTPFYFKDGNLLWLKPKETDSIFLKYLLEELIASDMGQLTGGTAYRALTIVRLSKMEIVVPSLALQRQFAAFASQVDKSRFVDLTNRGSKLLLLGKRRHGVIELHKGLLSDFPEVSSVGIAVKANHPH